jgi:protocatechuate 3,4-dioxygenase beta subunit
MRAPCLLFLVLLEVLFWGGVSPPTAAGDTCAPTAPDSEGPFYKPDAPRRSSVGRGYLLTGTVKSAVDCAPVPQAEIEFWLANPAGVYDDRHRAAVVADASGVYRFESSRPPNYGGRPPHIHMRITAAGFKPLVTQHYPVVGASEARFDVVLTPAD